MKMSFLSVLFGAAVFCISRSGRGQSDCGGDPLGLIFQDTAVTGEGHQTNELYAHAVDSVTLNAVSGRKGKATLYGGIVSQITGEDGVQGWSILAIARGGIGISDGTTEGTAAAPVPDGLLKGGFNKTEVETEATTEPCSYFASAIVLSLTEAVTLAPAGTATVASLLVEATVPQGPDPVVGTLEWKRHFGCPYNFCSATRFKCGQPVSFPVATVGGDTKGFCEAKSVTVTFVEIPRGSFIRGDSNSDGQVDISDAIRIFMWLFLGASEPSCVDAADANDDGNVDITDGIVILSDFFRPGTGIPAPGPFECGGDPRVDLLTCRSYSPCE